MRQLRSWADLSYRQLERSANDAGEALPRATISGVLARKDLPREELLGAFVRACGGNAATVEAWLEVRRRLAITTQTPDGSGETPPASSSHEATPATPDGPNPPEEPSSAPPPDTVDETTAESHPDDSTVIHAESDPQSGTDVSARSKTSLAQDDGDHHSTNAPSPQVPATAGHDDRPTRAPRLPMALTGACAAVGVLVLALWPNGGQNDNAPPPDSPRITAGPTKSTPAPTPSGKAKIRPSETPAEPLVLVRPLSGVLKSGWVQMHPPEVPSRCITEGNSDRTKILVAIQGRCSHLKYPQIYLKSLSNQTYQFKLPFDQGCLGVDEFPTGEIDLVTLVSPTDCADPQHTQYRLKPSGNGYVLHPTARGKCLDMQSPRSDGAELVEAQCTGASDQLFTFTPAQAPDS